MLAAFIVDFAVVVIGLNPVDQEVEEGEAANFDLIILYGLLERDVVVTLTTVEESAEGRNDCVVWCMQSIAHFLASAEFG